MKLLDRDLETNGRTWLDPRGLDKLMPTGPYKARAKGQTDDECC